MKFLHLKEAIEKSHPKKVDAHLPKVGRASNQSVAFNKVEGGWPVRTPINRQAAIVTSRASWIHMPPPKEKTKMSESQNGNRVSFSDQRPHLSVGGNEVIQPRGRDPKTGQNLYDVADFLPAMIEVADRRIKELNPIFVAADQSSKAIKEATYELGNQLNGLEQLTGTLLHSIRENRMAVISEVNQISSHLKDLRKFFLGPDHAVEIARLREFADLCERIKKLKDDGTLDAVSDTILKLS